MVEDEDESTRESGRGQLHMFGAVEEKVGSRFSGTGSGPGIVRAIDFGYVACGFSARFELGMEIWFARSG